jgi:hypothetical protein
MKMVVNNQGAAPARTIRANPFSKEYSSSGSGAALDGHKANNNAKGICQLILAGIGNGYKEFVRMCK